MKKYFIKNDAGQQGPFNLDELKDKGLTPETPVWHEGLEGWTTAGQVEEIKELIAPPPVVEEALAAAAVKPEEATLVPEPVVTVAQTSPVETTAPLEEVKPQSTVAAPPLAETAAAAPVAAASAPIVKAVRKKGNPVITWALSLVVLGGTGYYVYQDMEKNKDAFPATELTETTTNTTDPATDKESGDATIATETHTANLTTDPANEDTAAVTTATTTTTDPAVTTVTTTDNTDAVKKAEEEKKKLAALALIKKKEEEKKKQLAAEAKKKEEEKKKQLAAQALAAKEMDLRNKWARNITIGSYKLEGDDKVKPFLIPVHNSLGYAVDRVTLRVDYLKKEKIVFTETITINGISANGTSSAQATGNKKGHTANVYITGASSRSLHFCYPSTGGKSGDPYYCN